MLVQHSLASELVSLSMEPLPGLFRVAVLAKFWAFEFSPPVAGRQREFRFLRVASGYPSLEMRHSPAPGQQKWPAIEEPATKVSSR